MVQNQYYGTRDDLPFDLKHKAGPIQFTLAPNATKNEIAAEKTKLKSQLITALRPYLTASVSPSPAFAGAQPVGSAATFFELGEILGTIGAGTEDEINYNFVEPSAFYLRLMPGVSLSPFRQTRLMEIASRHRPDVLSKSRFSGFLDRNRFGVIALEASGTNTSARGFTQLFVGGEIWGVSSNFFRPYQGLILIPTGALENIYRRVLANYCELLNTGLGIAPPFTIEFGAVGLQGSHVGVGNNQIDGPIYNNEIKLRLVLNNLSRETQERAVKEFIDALLDLAGVERP